MMWNFAKWTVPAAVLLAAGVPAHAQAVTPVPVFVNGGRLESNAFLLQNVGRSVLPMRTLFESLGARVEWDGSQRAVYAWNPDRNGVRLGLGESVAQRMQMSGAPAPGNWGRVVGTQSLDAPAMMIDGRVFVPLRFASEALNADVRYASAEPVVYIRTQDVAGSREEPPLPRPRPRPQPDEDITRPRQIANALSVDVRVPQRVDRSDGPVRFVMTIRNTSDRPLVVPFNSGQRFDIEVLQEGKLIWNWAAGRAFTQALGNLSLQPGETTQFNARWDLRNNRDQAVQPGRYLVRGILTTSFRRPQIMAEEQFDITR